MTEDTKMILAELAKMNERMHQMQDEMGAMEQRINTRFDDLDKGIAINAKAISDLHAEMVHEFKAVRYELQTVHDMLNNRINDIDTVTAQNCKDITLLRAKQA